MNCHVLFRSLRRAQQVLLGCVVLMSCAGDRDAGEAMGVFEGTEVVVSAQVPGVLLSAPFAEGDSVPAGAALAQVDTVPLLLERRVVQAKLQALNPRYAHIATQTAALQRQIATAQHERARFASLLAQRAGTQKQVDDLDAQIALLQRQLAAQTQTLAQGNDALSAEGRTLEAQLAQANDRLHRARVTAPLTGRVLAKYVEAGETVAAGTPLYRLADTRRLTLRVYVDAPQITRLRLGQRVTVLADWGEDGARPYQGTVSAIASEAEFTPKTIQTRDERANLVYAVKVAVKNDGYIKLGMYGTCKF